MADRPDSERLRGFCDGLTDRRTFAIVESLSRLKITCPCNGCPARLYSTSLGFGDLSRCLLMKFINSLSSSSTF